MPVMAMPVIVVQGVDTAVKVISFFCRMTMKFQHDRAVTFLVAHMRQARAVRHGIICRSVDVVICLAVMVAGIACQLHAAIADQPRDVGQNDHTQDEEPVFAAPGASGEGGEVSERLLDKRPQVAKCHGVAFSGWLMSVSLSRMTDRG